MKRKLQRKPEVRVARWLSGPELLLDGERYVPCNKTAIVTGEWVVMMPVGERPDRVQVVRVELDGKNEAEEWRR